MNIHDIEGGIFGTLHLDSGAPALDLSTARRLTKHGFLRDIFNSVGVFFRDTRERITDGVEHTKESIQDIEDAQD
jgi:hypothetical protein